MKERTFCTDVLIGFHTFRTLGVGAARNREIVKPMETLLSNRLNHFPGKKGHRQKCFSVNFIKLLTASFDRTPLDDCFFLCLSVNFEKLLRTALLS